MKSRQIKFRALCDTDDGIRMVYFEPMTFDNGLWFQAINVHINEHLSQPMQFSGLLDKNGVEIYEGDIVAAKHRTKGAIYIGSIQMPKSCWVLELTNEIGKRRWYRTAEFSELEVIGNIHQNPELL